MDADLRDLLAAWLGAADLSAERQEALLARLRTDEALRRAFVDEVRLLGQLKIVQSPQPRWLRLVDELGWDHQQVESDRFADRVMQKVHARVRLQTTGMRLLAVAAIVFVVVGVVAL